MTSTSDNLKCVFCSEEFDDKELLQEHFRKHGDPTFDKSSKNKNKTQNEVPTSTEKMEDNELVGCDVCEEVFPTISKAITHKHKVHPDHDAKYFCPWCGKLFTMKHLYNKHLQSNHNSLTKNEKSFHCDSCSVNFYVASAMLHHNKFFHRQDTDLNSIGSSKKIKFFNQELVPIFYCPFCGEEYNNKVNLHKHMEDDHGDENQAPEDVLRCPLCEAFFYHLDAYELHLTFHSTEDVYSEQNEMVSEVMEFSLEAVPPIMEKVVQDAKIDHVNNFLEMAMNMSEDGGKVKAKKHKKHKKSKKEAITFDEFLNMNKDVFGDGLNVQGIEEVPTQMVLKKKYKTKKMPTNMEVKSVNSDLAKLKKQGIVIKAKPGKTPSSLNVQKKQTIGQNNQTNSPVLSNPNDVISKLLSHGNSEIKIVKKSIKPEPENKQDSYQSNKIDSSSDYNKSLDSRLQKENESCKDLDTVNSEISKQNNENIENITEENKETSQKEQSETQDGPSPEKNETTLPNMTKSDNNDEKSTMDTENSFKRLQNMESQLTIKSLDDSKEMSMTDEEKDLTDHIDHENVEENDSDTNDKIRSNISEDNVENDTFKSLNFNKGITIKAVGKNNTQSSTSDSENQDRIINKQQHNETQPKASNSVNQETKNIKQQSNATSHKSLEALKGLSKFITVKSSNASPSSNKNLLMHDSDENAEKSDQEDSHDDIDNELNKSTPQFSDTKETPSEIQTKKDVGVKNLKESPTTEERNAAILNRLTNVTAKSISSSKNTASPQNNKRPIPMSVSKEISSDKPDNVIEIFDIDDSDSEHEDVVKAKEPHVNKPLQKKSKINTIAKPAPSEALRGLSKNITIKSMSQQTSNYTEFHTKSGQECKKTVVNRSFESKNVNIIKGNNKFLEEQRNLQKTIQNLRKHVTVKSKTPPSSNSDLQSEKFDDAGSPSAAFADEEHDSDSSMGKVKITELNEDDVSDTENQHSEDETRVKVESPHSSDDERQNEAHDDDDNDDDIESQIKVNPIVNTNKQPKTSYQPQKSSNISHLNELTIKPLRKGNVLSEEENINDKISDTSRNAMAGKSANTKQQISKNIEASQKTSTSSNQISTVKSVKTYQSQTVIEEVTTTVTKTIRTVNTQEVQNTSQIISRPAIRPQKIMNKPVNNARATPVRQPSPAIGTKVRNSVPSSQSMSPNPRNMLVPARPRFNPPRTPNSSNIRKTTPLAQPRVSFTPNRPLKISPNVTNSAKRQSDEPAGHFSCFKKPKESLIPVQDLPNAGEEGTVQYSCSQSKSSFTNVTKISKDSASGTTSQMKSETTTASQQHIAKLSGMTGLKIVKTSSQQSKQVEEKCEVNSPKNDTIAALEKLQRQGLLIKKPRLDPPEYENNSFSGSDGETYEE